jgi:hypothetical protein
MKAPILPLFSRSLVPVAALTLCLPSTWASETYPDDQDPSSPSFVGPPYSWVHYDAHYGQPGHSAYKGVWRTPNNWPGKDAPGGTASNVTIRHEVNLNNWLYYLGGPTNPGVIPFPGLQGGFLEVTGLHFKPGGLLFSTLEVLSLDGVSTWEQGFIVAGGWSNPGGTVGGLGQIQNKGTVVVKNGGSVIGRTGAFRNTNRVVVDSSNGTPAALDIQAGHVGIYNESGVQPNPSVAEIELKGPNSSLGLAPNGGGPFPIIYNAGVLRKTGTGTGTIANAVRNYHSSSYLDPAPPVPPNRAGTIDVDEGTLLIDNSGFSNDSYWRGMNAELSPGTLLRMRGTHYFESGTTTVTGGGVLRLEPAPGKFFAAVTGVTDAVLDAPPGKLECAGADLRRLVNAGSLTVTAPSYMIGMVNTGHIRSLTGLEYQIGSNGTLADRSGVLEIVGPNVLYTASYLNNYGLLLKSGTGTAEIQGPSYHYGNGTNLNIEVTGGTLLTSSEVYFENGSNIRVANGAEVQFNYRNYQQGGTLNFTGSGKYYLNAGAFLSTTTPEVARTFNSAPGVFDCRGGRIHGPFTNAGEITVSAPSVFDRSFIGDNPITNAGTIRCLATSAGGDGSWSIVLNALVRIPCTGSSVLAFDIAGRPDNIANWARLRETGQTSITYDGKLRINFGNFAPAAGDRWLVIQNDSGIPNTGDFASVEFTNVPPGFTPTFEKLPAGIRVGLNTAPAPITYATWAAAQNFPTPAAAGFDVDPDDDGFTNGMECALGTNPQHRGSFPNIVTTRKDSGGDVFFAAQYKRPAAALRATDLQYIVERSDSLVTWTTDGLVVEASPPDVQNMETLLVRPAEPMNYKPRTFIRLRVVKHP